MIVGFRADFLWLSSSVYGSKEVCTLPEPFGCSVEPTHVGTLGERALLEQDTRVYYLQPTHA